MRKSMFDVLNSDGHEEEVEEVEEETEELASAR